MGSQQTSLLKEKNTGTVRETFVSRFWAAEGPGWILNAPETAVHHSYSDDFRRLWTFVPLFTIANFYIHTCFSLRSWAYSATDFIQRCISSLIQLGHWSGMPLVFRFVNAITWCNNTILKKRIMVKRNTDNSGVESRSVKIGYAKCIWKHRRNDYSKFDLFLVITF